MTTHNKQTALAVITGFAPGIGTQLAKKLISQGYQVVGLSRSAKSLNLQMDNFCAYACDFTERSSIDQAFATIKAEHGISTVLVHNAAELMVRDFMAVTPVEFERLWRTICMGAFLCTQKVLPDMLETGRGTLLFTGATASIRGSANFSAFASAKFALRGLAQSLARQYGSLGIHVIHAVLDGVIWGERAEKHFKMERTACMEPEAIAETYLNLIQQHPSSWTHEIDLRPSIERF